MPKRQKRLKPISAVGLKRDPRVLNFINEATAYCELLEKLPADWLSRVIERLPLLYSAAQSLPKTGEYQQNYEMDRRPELSVSHDEWARLWKKLGKELGKKRFYWVVFNPFENPPEEPVCGDIADGLAGIYCDLKSELNVWRTGDASLLPDVVFHLNLYFETHWGPHLLSILGPLHEIEYRNKR